MAGRGRDRLRKAAGWRTGREALGDTSHIIHGFGLTRNSAGHVTTRCVRRAWLFGKDRFSNRRFERALLAAMAYVDLNPIRAGIACNLIASRNTSIRRRCKAVAGDSDLAGERLLPIWGLASPIMPPATVGEYIELVDDAGRQFRKDKRGAIAADEPRALQKLGLSPDHWTRKVKGIGSGFWRVAGTVDDIREKAAAMQQQFLRGVGFARALVIGSAA